MNKLAKHLSMLHNAGRANLWHARNIEVGTEWREAITQHLNTANIILLLVSSDFMHSEYCYSVEMKQAMERYERGDVWVIPILLRPVDFTNAPFSTLQVLPKNATAITLWPDQDDAFSQVAMEIRAIVRKLNTDHLSVKQPQKEPDLNKYLNQLDERLRRLPVSYLQTFNSDQLHQSIHVRKRTYGLTEQEKERDESDRLSGRFETREAVSALFSNHGRLYRQGEESDRDIVNWEEVRNKKRQTFLLGDPGIGKSWLLCAEGKRALRNVLETAKWEETLSEAPLPVFVRLSALAECLTATSVEATQSAIITILSQEYGSPQPFLTRVRQWLEEGRCLLLFDALDEVAGAKRKLLRVALRNFLEGSPCTILLTSRFVGYELLRPRPRPDDGWQELELVRFGDTQIAHFIACWFTGMPDQEQTLWQQLLREQRLHELARIPLLLSFLCQIAEKRQGKLPVRRADIYEEILASLLAPSTWRGETDEHTTQASKRQVLKGAALYLLEKESSLSQVKLDSLGDKETIEELTRRDGILVKLASVSNQAFFSFLHRTLHEYLVAISLAEMPAEERWNWIQPHLWFDGTWMEVIPLLAGSLDNVDELLRQLLDEPYDPFHCALLVAGRCIGEVGSRDVDEELRIEVGARLRLLLHSSSDEDRREAFQLLITIQDRQTRDELLLELQKADTQRRKRAAESLGLLGDSYAVPGLLAALDDGAWEVRDAATWALDRFRDGRAVSKLIDTLGDRDETVAVSAANALIPLKSPHVVEELLRVLRQQGRYTPDGLLSRARQQSANQYVDRLRWDDGQKSGQSTHVYQLWRAMAGLVLGKLKISQARGDLQMFIQDSYADLLALRLATLGLAEFADIGTIIFLGQILYRITEGSPSFQASLGGTDGNFIDVLEGVFEEIGKQTEQQHALSQPLHAILTHNTAQTEQCIDLLLKHQDAWQNPTNYIIPALLRIRQTEPSISTILHSILLHGNNQLRGIVVFHLNDPLLIGDLLPVFEQIYPHLDETHRTIVVQKQMLVRDQRTLPLLKLILQDNSDYIRLLHALKALAAYFDTQVTFDLLREHQDLLSGDSEKSIFQSALAEQASSHPQIVEDLLQALGDKSSFVCECAAQTLTLLARGDMIDRGDGQHHKKSQWLRIVDALIFNLDDTRVEVRRAATAALRSLWARSAVGKLCSALKDQDEEVRKNAAQALGNIGDKRAVSTLLGALNDASLTVRTQVIEALGRCKDQQAIVPLSALLPLNILSQQPGDDIGEQQKLNGKEENALDSSLQSEFYQVVITALLNLRDQSITQQLFDALKRESPGIQKAIAFAMIDTENEQITEQLLQHLPTLPKKIGVSVANRIEFSYTAPCRQYRHHMNVLTVLINDASPFKTLSNIVNEENIKALGKIGNQCAAEVLSAMIAHIKVSPVPYHFYRETVEIGEVLAQIAHPVAILDMLYIAQLSTHSVPLATQKNIVRALRRIGTQEAIEGLILLLHLLRHRQEEHRDDEMVDLCIFIVELLAEVRTSVAVEGLIASQNDPNIRHAAAQALGIIGGKEIKQLALTFLQDREEAEKMVNSSYQKVKHLIYNTITRLFFYYKGRRKKSNEDSNNASDEAFGKILLLTILSIIDEYSYEGYFDQIIKHLENYNGENRDSLLQKIRILHQYSYDRNDIKNAIGNIENNYSDEDNDILLLIILVLFRGEKYSTDSKNNIGRVIDGIEQYYSYGDKIDLEKEMEGIYQEEKQKRFTVEWSELRLSAVTILGQLDELDPAVISLLQQIVVGTPLPKREKQAKILIYEKIRSYNILGVRSRRPDISLRQWDIRSQQADISLRQAVRLRCLSIEALARLNAKQALPDIREVFLDRNEDIRVRETAIEALGKIGGSQEIDMILACLNEPNDEIRSTALLTLVDIGGTPTIKGLLAALSIKKKEPGSTSSAYNLAIAQLEETSLPQSYALSDFCQHMLHQREQSAFDPSTELYLYEFLLKRGRWLFLGSGPDSHIRRIGLHSFTQSIRDRTQSDA